MQVEEISAQRNQAASNLAQAQDDRDMFAKQYEEVRRKHKSKRKEWAEERNRLMRCLDAQTKANTAHLQEIARQIGPNGSLRQSLDLSFSQAGSEFGTPRSVPCTRRHSFAAGSCMGRLHSGSMCSSPHHDALGFPIHASHDVRDQLLEFSHYVLPTGADSVHHAQMSRLESPQHSNLVHDRQYAHLFKPQPMYDVPEAENSQLCESFFGNENEVCITRNTACKVLRAVRAMSALQRQSAGHISFPIRVSLSEHREIFAGIGGYCSCARH
jgi:hypothetical protein